MLRLPSLLGLAIACVVFTALLEVLNVEIYRHQGIDANQQAVTNCIQYIPTIAAILLGFVWRSLVSDLKLMMPWSAITERTTSASESIMVDYVNKIEVLSILMAARKGHWPLWVGLVGAILAGVLVSFTNALTYVDIYGKVSQDSVSLRQSSKFNFTDALSYGNGTLAMAWDYTGSQPYAALTSTQQSNGKYSTWTTDGYVFTSFESSDAAPRNTTLLANATAFSAHLNCTHVRTSLEKPSKEDPPRIWRVLRRNAADLKAAGCEDPTAVRLMTPPGNGNTASSIISDTASEDMDDYTPTDTSGLSWATFTVNGSASTAAWLNLTQCGSSQSQSVKLWANMLRPAGGNLSATKYDVQSLLCQPQYLTQKVSLSVNSSTGDVLSFVSVSNTSSIVTGITPDVLMTYLNNPLDSTSLSAYQATSWEGGKVLTSKAEIFPNVSFTNVTIWADYYFSEIGQDPFFTQLLSGDDGSISARYFNNSTAFASDVSGLVGNYMAQVVNNMARQKDDTPIEGSFVIVGPRTYLRQWGEYKSTMFFPCLC